MLCCVLRVFLGHSLCNFLVVLLALFLPDALLSIRHGAPHLCEDRRDLTQTFAAVFLSDARADDLGPVNEGGKFLRVFSAVLALVLDLHSGSSLNLAGLCLL